MHSVVRKSLTNLLAVDPQRKKHLFLILAMTLPTLSILVIILSLAMSHPTEDPSSANSTNMPSNDNPLTSHVLDTAIGRPAAGIKVILSKQEDGQWRHIAEQDTNADGRIGNIISGEEFTPGVYKLNFDTKSYYGSRGEKTFYPFIDVVFEIEQPEEHYHVPILISAYSFSTYRGS